MVNQPISTTATGMQRAADVYDTKIAESQTNRGRVNSEVQTLLSTWTGEASGIFRQAMTQWDADFNQIIQRAQWVREQIAAGGKQYQGAEQNNADAARQFAGGLPGL
ncbi:WXG100 family type VII secretion target [Saccharopolyspora sp. 5N708]|uniref:WXG100 family type VII secretion target n=1 Tax=Saccharopolyspora sp. 5N708 TaxID=3457424 RepID=UPI003FD3D072